MAMHSLSQHFNKWLLQYPQSELFGCDSGNAGCEYYHVLSPILHHLGLLNSYSAYRRVILKVLSETYLKINQPNILVVGIESEESANSLIQSLDFFKEKYQLTFIDCCPTPLNRINACLESFENNYIKTRLIDIFTPSANQLFSKFDVVFADSFLKQFSSSKKTAALGIIAKFTKNEDSRIIIREHVGDINQLLPSLWAKMEGLLKGKDWYVSGDSPESKQIQRLIEKIDHHYKKVGEIYKNPGDLKTDIIKSGLELVEEYINKKEVDRIIIAANCPSLGYA